MQNFSGEKDAVLCSIFDGHGPNGHMVSRYVRDYLPAKITKYYEELRSHKGGYGSDDLDCGVDVNQEYNPYFLFWKDRLVRCFHEMDDELESDAPVDSYSSGTTSVSVLKKVHKIYYTLFNTSRSMMRIC